MALWMIWFIVAIILISIEIFSPTFFYLSLGIGALLAGIFAYIIPSFPFQVVIFVVFALLFYLWFKKNSTRLFVSRIEKTKIDSLKHKKGILTKGIIGGRTGYIKIGREEWPAVGKDEESIESGKVVRVLEIAGNKLLVTSDLEDDTI